MYDSTLNQGFLVHQVDGTTQVFRPSRKGLFYSDIKNDIGHIFVNTVDSNKSKYTIKEYSDAVRACSLQDIIGLPNTTEFIQYIERNKIPSCPVQKLMLYMSRTFLEQMSDTYKEN